MQLIKKNLEQEFGLINISREAALSSTSGELEKRILTNSGKEFVWADLKGIKLDFVECSAKSAEGDRSQNYSLDPVREWIDLIKS